MRWKIKCRGQRERTNEKKKKKKEKGTMEKWVQRYSNNNIGEDVSGSVTTRAGVPTINGRLVKSQYVYSIIVVVVFVVLFLPGDCKHILFVECVFFFGETNGCGR